MKQIFDSIIRRKVLYLVYFLADGLSEIIIDIPLSFETFNTIEIIDNCILLHSFNDTLEFTTDFDDLDMNDKIEIYQRLFMCLCAYK